MQADAGLDGQTHLARPNSDSAWVCRMTELTRDWTAEPGLRDQILRRERGQGKFMFHDQLTTSRIGDHTG